MISNKQKFFIVIAAVVIVLGVLVLKTINKVQSDKATLMLLQRLPEMPFYYLYDGKDSKDKPTIVVLFSPDCDYCHRTAEELVANKNELNLIQVIMVTQSGVKETKEFFQKYKLSELPDLKVAVDKKNEFHKYFGNANVPTFYLYNNKHVFIQKIQGETKVSHLIKLLK